VLKKILKLENTVDQRQSTTFFAAKKRNVNRNQLPYWTKRNMFRAVWVILTKAELVFDEKSKKGDK